MASCQTTRWVANSAPYVKLTVTQSSSTDTSATLSWTLQYISDYPANAGSRDYTVKIAGSTVKTGTYNINGVTGTKTIASGTKTITKSHSAQTISFSVSFDFEITWSGVYAGTKTAAGSISVAKQTSYTVSYNANGGSGVPSSQTKWHGETLTLSSTKPTRSGYTFVGWGTSTTDTSADWSAGGSYTTNASDTLYAIWKKTITLSYGANGGSGVPDSQSATVYNATTSYTFTIPSTTPTRTGYNFKGWSTSSSATSASYTAGSKITLSSSDTLYAVWSLKTYTVSYNANGGTNAPSSQKKDYGKDLVLTSSKPTWSGYAFKGWATSPSGSVVYSAGATYSSNASVTLYAVWQLITYTVTYNANGGSGAPANQTKTHGTDLVLSSTKPTRQYYNFKGWAASSTATSPTHYPNGVYKTNSNLNLYAVWEVAYIVPRITSIKVTRCDADGNPQDDGTYALVKFKWATDEDVSQVRIYFTKDSGSTAYRVVSASGKSGSASEILGNGDTTIFSTDSAYQMRIRVVDTTDQTEKTVTLPATIFPIDLKKGGRGVSIGSPAKEDGFRVEMDTYFKGRKYGENKVLWTGENQMGDGASVVLSGDNLISAQPHGVVLVWSYHNGTEAKDYYWNYSFIPKWHISTYSGTGVCFSLATQSTTRLKYLYVRDTGLTGYSSNTSDSNKALTLRAIIGV